MDVEQDYNDKKNKYLQTFNYWEEAGKLAVARFKDFNISTTAQFFALFGSVYKESSVAYKFFFKNLADIKAGKQSVPSHHLKALIAIIPPCLVAEDQVKLLRYELLEYLQKYKLALTRKFTLTTDVNKAFNTYSKYLAGIYYMGSMPSVWFSELAYNAHDRHELIQALQYIQVLKLKASVSHFKKDVQLISQKARNLSKKVLYFVEFLGMEVAVAGKEYDLNRLSTYDETPLPTFTGNFAPTLNQYMTDELAKEDYQTVLREMQEAVLAHDLGKAIQHFKNNNTLNTRADISFALQGGAGIVRLEIRSWLTRLLLGDFKKWEKITLLVIPFLVALGVGVWLDNNMLPALFVGFLMPSLMKNFGMENRLKQRKELEDEIKMENNLDLAYLNEPYLAQYKSIMQARVVDKGYLLLENNPLEEVRERWLNAITSNLISHHYQYTHDPADIQELYQKFVHAIQSETHIFTADLFGSQADREECFEAVRYVIALQYNTSRRHFNALMDLLLSQHAEAKYYNYLLRTECVISSTFYKKEGEVLERVLDYVQTIFGGVSPVEKYQAQANLNNYNIYLAYPLPEPVGKYADLIKAWVAKEREALQEDLLERELAKTRQYLSFLEQSYTTPHLQAMPFLLEGAEGILYI